MASCDPTTIPSRPKFFPRSIPGTHSRESLIFDAHADRWGSRAPPSILNVLPDQPVELRVSRRTDEDYVPTPQRGFAGSGNRLGGVVPESASVPQVGMPGAFPSPESSSAASATPPAPPPRDPDTIATRFSVDQTKPTTSVQVRLADGTRFERCCWFANRYTNLPPAF